MGGVGTGRTPWVFGLDEMSAIMVGEDMLEAEAKRRVAMRIGVRRDRSGT